MNDDIEDLTEQFEQETTEDKNLNMFDEFKEKSEKLLRRDVERVIGGKLLKHLFRRIILQDPNPKEAFEEIWDDLKTEVGLFSKRRYDSINDIPETIDLMKMLNLTEKEFTEKEFGKPVFDIFFKIKEEWKLEIFGK